MADILRNLRITTLHPSRYQARTVFDPTALAELAASIEQHGLINPLIIFYNDQGNPELVAGERRTRAMLALSSVDARQHKTLAEACQFWSTHGLEIFDGTDEHNQYGELCVYTATAAMLAPCHVLSNVEPAQIEEIALIDNLQRQDLAPLDEARAIKQMIDEHSYTQRQLAGRLGKSQTWISQRLVLLDLAPELVEQVMAGELDQTAARELARLDPAAQVQAHRHVTENKISARSVKNLVGRILELSDPATWQPAGENARSNQLIGAALATKPTAERQQAMIATAARMGGTLHAPKDVYEYRRLINALGLTENEYTNASEAFMQHADLVGAACDNCKVYPFMQRVSELRRSLANERELPDEFPACSMDRPRVCVGYIPETATEVRMRVPWANGVILSPDDQRHLLATGWNATVDDVFAGIEIATAVFAYQAERATAEAENKRSGIARAIAELADDQIALTPGQLYNQPCTACAFHKAGSRDPLTWCHYQRSAPTFDGWGHENEFAGLWRGSNGAIVARCRMFRWRKIEEDLLRLRNGAIRAPAAVFLELLMLRSTQYGQTYLTRSWLNCAGERTKADADPAWGAASKHLTEIVPRLSDGQRMALLVLWSQSWEPDRNKNNQVTTIDPETGEPVQWGRVVVYGQSGVTRTDTSIGRRLVEVFAGDGVAAGASDCARNQGESNV
jgi:ParB family chromosome partitioning protein